jgi:hypothetical protein
MLHRIVRTAIVFLGSLVPSLGLCAGDQPPAANPPNQGILLLRNGQTLEGRIVQGEGLFVVDLGDGQIRVKAADVELVCSSLEDGYRRKRAAIQVGNVHHHLELAQWCLRHGLLGPAAAELADATAAEPNNPMIGAVQHRLKMALEPPVLPDAAGKATSGPSNEELDQLVRSLPHGSVETFTQSVQPVLINHCATGGCHGPQSDTALRLYRIPTGKSASRRITQRNLYSVLSFVDRDNPASSRLLTAPSGPHGAAKHAIFNEHQAVQYKRLVDWANQLAQQSAPESPATLSAAMPSEAANPASVEAPPRTLSPEARKAHPLSVGGQNQTARRGAARSPSKSPADVAPAPSQQPADPFDPEVFNRRCASQKSRSKGEHAPRDADADK